MKAAKVKPAGPRLDAGGWRIQCIVDFAIEYAPAEMAAWVRDVRQSLLVKEGQPS